MIRPMLAALLVAAYVVSACGSAQDVEAKQSAGQVALAVERLRAAPNAAKAQALQALEQLSCTGPDVCETRAACHAAYALHVEALALTEAARAQISDGQSREAAKVLGAAQQKLGAANVQIQGCTERESALKRRYKL